MDLTKLIIEKVAEVESSGKLDEIIERNTISCLEELVRESFSWRGIAYESMKKALEVNLAVTLKGANLGRYQKIVSGIVEDQLNGTVIEGLKNTIGESVGKITGVLEKNEWKLSEIIAKFIEGIDSSMEGEMEHTEGECTLIIEESSSNYYHIYFDKDPDVEQYSCTHSIHLDSEGKIYHARVDQKDFSPFTSPNLSESELFFFKLYCSNVKIEVDRDNCNLEYYREDDY